MAIFGPASRLIGRQIQSLSGLGMAMGTLFFAASLTPTLIPRSSVTQGALAGACLAIGYLLGIACKQLWRYLELPDASGRTRQIANGLIGVFCLAILAYFMWRAADWQNGIRAAMDLPPVSRLHSYQVCLIAIITFAILLLLGRLFGMAVRAMAGFTRRFVPRRVAAVISIALVTVLVWSLVNNLLFRGVLRILDNSFREYDALLEPERPQPVAAGKTGSPASLVKWDELGRAGREYIAAGPDAAEIADVAGGTSIEPVRVYVGLRAADTAEERARLALEELKRVGGFDRSVLVIVTPTGTGWVDPSAMDTLEFLQRGDVASVAVQYSYLNSPLSLLVEPEFGAESARALFVEIYSYWTKLPKDSRPRLYLHGLSLGAMNSERSAGLFEILGDPLSGALWSGPPFESATWRTATAARNAGTPEWLPEFGDSRIVRFMNQNGSTIPSTHPWGPMRVVYLQYASDAIVFFRFQDAYRPPAWMTAPTGPDVSPHLGWYPVVTMLQLALDMAVATSTPMGYGHVYAPEHYVNAWAAVVDPPHWSAGELTTLKEKLAIRARIVEQDMQSGEHPYENRGG